MPPRSIEYLNDLTQNIFLGPKKICQSLVGQKFFIQDFEQAPAENCLLSPINLVFVDRERQIDREKEKGTERGRTERKVHKYKKKKMRYGGDRI